MIYNPSLSEEEINKKLKKLRKLKYNQFRWWRMYDDPNPPKHKYCLLIDKIQNGDFDFSHYRYQAMWCEHEMNKIYKQNEGNLGRFIEETSLLRARRKKLLEDFYKDEENRLENLYSNFSIEFRLPKKEIKNIISSFEGTIEELYLNLKQKYPSKY